ncbi:hypothetical protein R3P38DRAFT_3187038 [Favolaschia claudopus]|uniref:Uncharacterized protein n=1 Tax=Favolaschia claudopus TaxID=2862362 RepID=A0AAW0C0N6_9AGAR
MQRSRLRNPNAVPPPSSIVSTPRIPTRVFRIICSGIDALDDPEEPHIYFPLEKRLQQALARQDPSLPYPGDALPGEHVPSAIRALEYYPFPYLSLAGNVVQPLRSPQRKRAREREAARSAAVREGRFRTMLEASIQIHHKHHIRLPSYRALRHIPSGPTLDDLSFIEDRDYSLAELQHFQLRNVDWDGINVRVVASDARALLVLAGFGITGDWEEEVLHPLNAACAAEAQALRHRNPDGDPILFSGVGHYFNEEKPKRYPGSRTLDLLATRSLFSSIPMKRLVSYTNSLLEAYCPTAFSALEDQKTQMLQYDPDAEYPCETSVFSATTLELGGPHYLRTPFGPCGRFDPSTWCIITSLGIYDCRRGGHIILWDIGWILVFPPGASILLPPGLVRYSFVEVQPHESRYLLIQQAGSGIRRFFENGERRDVEFAVEATRAEHVEREVKRRQAHLAAAESFERVDELPLGYCLFPYRGQNPPPAPFRLQ